MREAGTWIASTEREESIMTLPNNRSVSSTTKIWILLIIFGKFTMEISLIREKMEMGSWIYQTDKCLLGSLWMIKWTVRASFINWMEMWFMGNGSKALWSKSILDLYIFIDFNHIYDIITIINLFYILFKISIILYIIHELVLYRTWYDMIWYYSRSLNFNQLIKWINTS